MRVNQQSMKEAYNIIKQDARLKQSSSICQGMTKEVYIRDGWDYEVVIENGVVLGIDAFNEEGLLDHRIRL